MKEADAGAGHRPVRQGEGGQAFYDQFGRLGEELCPQQHKSIEVCFRTGLNIHQSLSGQLFCLITFVVAFSTIQIKFFILFWPLQPWPKASRQCPLE